MTRTNRHPRAAAGRPFIALAGCMALVLAACTGDGTGQSPADETEPDTVGEAPDAEPEETAPEDATGDAGTATDAAPLSGATVVWDGEPLVTTGVICEEFGLGAGAVDVESIEATIADLHGHEGAFRAMWSIEDERMERVVLTWEEEDGFEVFRADFRNDDPEGTVEFDGYARTHGELALVAGTDRAAEVLPDGGVVEFDVSCDA